jgi:hypothetical protein
MILERLLELASRFSGSQACANSRVYADLDINGSDFIEFIAKIERDYEVNLDWVSPRDRSKLAYDPTIGEIAAFVTNAAPN